ncbi:MAG: M20 family metallopeptidase [Gammaproteobacteria bacterium]|nr:M20 family metallopeptidase [Gammaproteobacteria bacterium]
MHKLNPALEAEMIEWRHDLHRYPEFGFEENRTSDFIASRLQDFGIEVVRHIGQTGLVGILKKGNSERSIGLRADMDALKVNEQNTFDYKSCNDGLMHACGHDGHSTMLLGAAKHLIEQGNFDGTVYFIFQPAEEHGKGALSMIEDGLFEKWQIDSVFGLHNLPGLPEGEFAIRPASIMASESGFEIRVTGKGGHAAMPHMGVDALLVGSQIVVALQSIVSRNLSALHETAVVSVTEFITDGTVNVIPTKVTLKGDCRCFTDEALEKLNRSMERIVSGICAAAGATYEFDFVTTFPSTINHPVETQHAIQAAIDTLGADQVNGSCDPYTISEDFANMLRVRPGCYGLLGNGGDAGGGCALHNPNYDFNDRILMTGASYWVNLVENKLSI